MASDPKYCRAGALKAKTVLGIDALMGSLPETWSRAVGIACDGYVGHINVPVWAGGSRIQPVSDGLGKEARKE